MPFPYTAPGIFEAFCDEYQKIALDASSEGEVPTSDVDQEKKQDSHNDFMQRAGRAALDIGVTAAGYGAGYGIGKATGAFLKGSRPGLFQQRWVPHALGGTVAAAGLLSRVLDRNRQHYVNTGKTL